MLTIKKFVFNPVQENTYLVYDETKEAVIIDCGALSPLEKKGLKSFIEENGLKLMHLLNTHLHMDHAYGNAFISEEYGIQPEYNQAEDSMPSIPEQSRLFGIKLDNEPLLTPARYLNEGDEIHFGNSSLRVLLTPGHSPGGICFYSADDHKVFSGDVLFREDIGRSDLWGGNEEGLIAGIKNKLFTLPENTIVYPGHGPETSISHEKQHNPYIR